MGRFQAPSKPQAGLGLGLTHTPFSCSYLHGCLPRASAWAHPSFPL